jgi:Histidine kinase
VVVPVVRGAPISVGRPSVGDVVLVGVAGGLALGVVTVFAVPPLVLGIALQIALFLPPAWRRILAPRAKRLLLADVRERATIEASEAERAHLARELHDAPLPQLAGVIRRLELLPTARAENDQLRAVAEQLRGMATELRPPVLDDLGLVAAIEFIAERDATDAIGISVHVADETGLVAASRRVSQSDASSSAPTSRTPTPRFSAVRRTASIARRRSGSLGASRSRYVRRSRRSRRCAAASSRYSAAYAVSAISMRRPSASSAMAAR